MDLARGAAGVDHSHLLSGECDRTELSLSKSNLMTTPSSDRDMSEWRPSSLRNGCSSRVGVAARKGAWLIAVTSFRQLHRLRRRNMQNSLLTRVLVRELNATKKR